MGVRFSMRALFFSVGTAVLLASLLAPAYASKRTTAKQPPPIPQDTGFLNRTVTVKGITYRFQVYVPEQWKPTQSWPIILFLHGRGERGSEGLWQTQVGLPMAVRDHP